MPDSYISIDGKLAKVTGIYTGMDGKVVQLVSGYFGKDNVPTECYQFRNLKTPNMLLTGTVLQCSTDTVQDDDGTGTGTHNTIFNSDHTIRIEAGIVTVPPDSVKQTNYIGLQFPRDEYKYKKLFVEFKINDLQIKTASAYNDIRFRVFRIVDGKALVGSIPVETETKSIYAKTFKEYQADTLVAEIDIDPNIEDQYKFIFGIDMNAASNSSFKVDVLGVYLQER